jgi:hypothetical protein
MASYPGGIGTIQNVHLHSADYTAEDLSTFMGCYGKIVSLCKEVSPSCRIFLITTPHMENTNNVNIENTPRLICESNIFTHVYLVDFAAYLPNVNSIYGSGHLYCQGYQYYAYAFMNYVDYIIRNNPSDFKNMYYVEYLANDTGQV